MDGVYSTLNNYFNISLKTHLGYKETFDVKLYDNIIVCSPNGKSQLIKSIGYDAILKSSLQQAIFIYLHSIWDKLKSVSLNTSNGILVIHMNKYEYINYLARIPGELIDMIISYLSYFDVKSTDLQANWRQASFFRYSKYHAINNKAEYLALIADEETEEIRTIWSNYTNGFEKDAFIVKEVNPSRFINITMIVMMCQHIRIIPAQIGILQHLEILMLGCNDIEIIPDEMGDLKNLASINLFDNKIKRVPVRIWKLPRLTFVSLGSNKDLDTSDFPRKFKSACLM
jgi:hypothetical protein